MNNPMDQALLEALEGMSIGDGGPFGAVVVREGKIVGSGHNEVLKTNDPTAHAEITAIRRASETLGTYDLSGCILYTSCYPCPMCMGAIFWARIPAVYYAATMDDAAEGGFDDRRFYTMIRHPESALDLRPMDNAKGKEVFERWRAKEDRTVY